MLEVKSTILLQWAKQGHAQILPCGWENDQIIWGGGRQ
jgi:hypothetical protein